MPSTRESSPAVESNPSSPTQLTPRSKVKALLARLDDSDDESVSASPRKGVAAVLTKPSPKSKYPTSTKSFEEAITNTNASKTDDTTEDEEEEDIVRPKGRLAARMHTNLHGSEDAENSGNAIERVRKMLATKSKSPEPTSDSEKAASDDSDAPVIPRKRKIRTTRRETPQSSPEKRQPSPGLFVSPSKENAASNSAGDDSDSDLPAVDDDRFKALVQKKREERLAREAEAAKEKARKLAERRQMEQRLENDDDIVSDDDDAERRLTQPTRRAGKKAAEEIRRETQRMSRNQQLAHKPVTKKKYAKADFLAKFNMGPKKEASDPILPTSSSSPAPQSDVEMKETPPTSPASIDGDAEKPAESLLPEPAQENDDEDMPTLEDVLTRIPSSPPPTRLDKGKGREVKEPTAEPETKKKPVSAQRPIRVRVPKIDKKAITIDDSDSDLEIISAKTPNRQRRKIDSIFDRIPAKQAKESHSIHALRMLAQVKSPGKPTGKNKKPSMTTGELQMSLQQKARQQAAREREERLQELRDKGIIVQTAEEREKEMAEVEDLIAKARREGEEIMKREKAASKEERKANGEVDPLGDNSSDDEDWEEEKVPDADADAELSLSGSEDENEDPENSDGDASGEEEEGDNEPVTNPLFDNEASESDAEEEEADLTIPEPVQDANIDEDDLEQAPVKLSRRNKQRVVSDDEDDESHDESYSVPQTQSPKLQLDSPTVPTSVLRSATKTFIPGVTVAGPAGLGLTQIFAGTMDESQGNDDLSQTASNLMSPPKNNHPGLAFLRNIPAPELPDFVPTMEEDTQDQDMIMNSQPEGAAETQNFDSMPGIQLDFSQSQIHEFDSLVQDSQTPFPEATQDLGYQPATPIRGRFVEPPPSTVDTVMLDPCALPETTMETPIVKKKGKLRQRNRIASFSDEEDVDEPVSKATKEDDYEIHANIFDVMRKASRKKKIVVDEFDKKNSKAKDMVHEQADESEDEYAGLGGASDDESGGEADAFVKEMIDDDSKQHVDEGKLSAFFA